MNDDHDDKLEVPLRVFVDEFSCPICFEWIEDCLMTPCGHVFCQKCIEECLNRSHKCPSCNHKTEPKDLVSNKHADRIVSLVQRQKDIASKAYFEKLIAGNASVQTSNLSESQTELLMAKELSPVEKLFQQHMQQSLLVYDKFLDDINKKCKAAQDEVKAKQVKKMEQASKKLKGDALNAKVAKLVGKCEAECAQLERGREESQALVLQQFEEHLKQCATAPELLPCVVRIRLADAPPDEHVRATLKPAEIAGIAVRRAFEARQRERGDAVVSWPLDVRFEMTVLNKTKPLRGDVALGASGMQSDAQIIIHGDVVLTSNVPKQCFADEFVEGASMDYKTCRECRLNWICKSCAETCHAGHTLSVFMDNHQPSWNCCYCSKKRKATCKLIKK